jgi:hypothetical protein
MRPVDIRWVFDNDSMPKSMPHKTGRGSSMTPTAGFRQRTAPSRRGDPRARGRGQVLYWAALSGPHRGKAESMMSEASSGTMRDFLRDHNIHEVECVIADMTGIARGKILPKDLFLSGEHMRLPKSVLLNTVHGEQPNNTP